MTTYTTTSYETSKRVFTETRRTANYIQEEGQEPIYTGSNRGTRTRTITTTKTGPFTSAEADAALTSDDTRNAAGAGTVTTSQKSRANAAGMYYVETTVDVTSAWTWVEE